MKPTVTCVVTLFALAAVPATRPVYDSPAAVVAASRQAYRTGDVRTGIDCLSPVGRQKAARFVTMMLVRGHSTTLPAKDAAERQAFEDKYGLSDRTPRPGETTDQLIDRLTAAIPDQRAFLTDFAARAQQSHKAPSSTAPSPELTGVTVAADGRTATADLSRTNGNGTMTQHLHFTKVDGGWLLDDLMFY